MGWGRVGAKREGRWRERECANERQIEPEMEKEKKEKEKVRERNVCRAALLCFL